MMGLITISNNYTWVNDNLVKTLFFIYFFRKTLSLLAVFFLSRTFIYSLSITGGKPTPFYAFALAFIFCAGNGFMQARGALLLSKYSFNEDTFTTVRVAFGLFLYVFGLCANIQCDGILRNLRKPGETGYKIPRGIVIPFVFVEK